MKIITLAFALVWTLTAQGGCENQSQMPRTLLDGTHRIGKWTGRLTAEFPKRTCRWQVLNKDGSVNSHGSGGRDHTVYFFTSSQGGTFKSTDCGPWRQ